MADIFISYANEDRSRAETIAKALEDKGWSVWWDRTIPPGKTFDIMIEEAINAASCVVVLWSKKSVKSDWVKEEANVGKERKILVPAKIDAIDPPFGFGRIQAADLTKWEKDSSHTGFVSFVNAISDIVQSRPPEETGGQVAAIPESDLGKQLEGQPEENKAPQPAPVADPEKKKTVRWAIGIALALVVMVIGLVVLQPWVASDSEKSEETKPKPKSDQKVLKPPEKTIFDPKEKSITIPSKKAPNPVKQITLEAWVNPSELGKRQPIITKLHPGYQSGEPYYQYHLELRDSGALYFALAIGGMRKVLDGAFIVEPKKWYHVAATYDGTSMRLYLNGEEWENPTKAKGALSNYNMPLVIGGVSDLPFTGLLAEVRIWDVARTRDQIIGAMDKTLSVKEKGLVWVSTGIDPIIINSIGMKFILISEGDFNMGSQTSPEDLAKKYNETAALWRNEFPRHPVAISKPFYLQSTEVTQGQWKSIMKNNQSLNRGCDDCPVETVYWHEAQKFISELNRKEKTDKYRLPTEAEWEYACRAKSTTQFSFGEEVNGLAEYAWYQDNSGGRTHPVGKKKPNSWGLYDMHGNVWEWCQDWYGNYPPGPVTDPKGPDNGKWRMTRGGSWTNQAAFLRSAKRLRQIPETRLSYIGFRVARDP